jgi:RimJ/RimL family protein N-acetyltransferase
VELVAYTESDLPLTAALECDPVVMRHLGGPIARADIRAVHRRRLDSAARGDWWFKIVPEAGGPPAGAIGVWETTWQGVRIHEVGWMMLASCHGRGLASRALGMLLARIRADPRFDVIHAFPGADNEPSNALCRKFGFERREQCAVDYSGRVLRCNHWLLAVRENAAAARPAAP